MSFIIQNPQEDPNFEPERQCGGFTIAIFGATFFSISVIFLLTGVLFSPILKMELFFLFLGTLSLDTFFILSLHSPSYLGGNPGIEKLAPFLIGNVLLSLGSALMEHSFVIVFLSLLIISVLSTGLAYILYIKNDSDPEACGLCMKPWVYKRKFMGFPNFGAAYPPVFPAHGPIPVQGNTPAYVPQGYPPFGQAPVQGYPSYVQTPVQQMQTPVPQAPYPSPIQTPQAYVPQAYPSSPAVSPSISQSHFNQFSSPTFAHPIPEKPGYQQQQQQNIPSPSSMSSSPMYPPQAPPPYHIKR